MIDQRSHAAVETNRPRSGRKWLILALVLLLVAIGAGGIVVASDDPIEIGGHSGTPNAGNSVIFSDDPDDGARIIQYRHGAELVVRFSVRNGGRWGVTVTAIPRRDFALFTVEAVRMGFAEPRCCIDTQPFHPFALRPGEDRFIDLHGRLTGCGAYVSGGGTEWDRYEVRYRVLGMPKTTTIVAHQTIRIEIPSSYDCPEPRPGG